MNINQTNHISHWQLLNPIWYGQQFKGWTRLSYTLLGVGLLIITYTSFAMGAVITSMTFATFFAAAFGWITVLGLKEAKPMNGLFGLLSAAIYIYVAWLHRNPADAMLQLTYVILLDIPVLIMPGWVKNTNQHVRFIHETDIRGEKHGKVFWYTMLTVIAIIAFVAAYLFETKILHTPRPISDSLVLGTGLIGAVLTTFRFSESWFAWLLQGIMQIILWGLTVVAGGALGASAIVILVTYLMYFANDILALLQSSWFHHKDITAQLAKNSVK